MLVINIINVYKIIIYFSVIKFPFTFKFIFPKAISNWNWKTGFIWQL